MFGFYLDPACTTPAKRLVLVSLTKGLPGLIASAVVYLGSPIKEERVVAADGGDIFLAAQSSAGDLLAGHLLLATSEAGLMSAVPGQALSVGQSLLGGSKNSIQIWFGISAEQIEAGEYEGLGLVSSEVIVA